LTLPHTHSLSNMNDAEKAIADENMVNDEKVEVSWAVTAVEFAEDYSKLLSLLENPEELNFGPLDNELYFLFRKAFPKLNVEVLDEDFIKSKAQKELWRPFLLQWENQIDDFNMATLIRVNSKQEFSPENSTIVPRVQFYCFELARARENVNINSKPKSKYHIGVCDFANWSNRGAVAFRDGDFVNALDCFERAQKHGLPHELSSPQLGIVLANLSASHLKLGNVEAALEAAEKCIAHDQAKMERGFRRKAEALVAFGKPLEAAQFYHQSLVVADLQGPPSNLTIERRKKYLENVLSSSSAESITAEQKADLVKTAVTYSSSWEPFSDADLLSLVDQINKISLS